MHYLRTLKRFYRDFMGKTRIGCFIQVSYSWLQSPYILTSEELQKWYSFVDSVKDDPLYNGDPLRLKALFLILASSGLRLGGARALRLCDVDFSTGKVSPYHVHATATSKKSNFSFINFEALDLLRKYVNEKGITEPETRLFEGNNSDWPKQFQIVSEKAGIKLTPKNLRSWFSSESAELGISDRYVDFAGQNSKKCTCQTLLGLQAEKLQRIYQKAGLKVLGASNSSLMTLQSVANSLSSRRIMTLDMMKKAMADMSQKLAILAEQAEEAEKTKKTTKEIQNLWSIVDFQKGELRKMDEMYKNASVSSS